MSDPIRRTVWSGTLLSTFVMLLCIMAQASTGFAQVAVPLAGAIGAGLGYKLGHKRSGLMAAGISLISVLCCAWVVLPWPVNKFNYFRIHKGMHLSEVEAVLGSPDSHQCRLGEMPSTRVGCEAWITDEEREQFRFAGYPLKVLTVLPAVAIPRDLRRWTTESYVVAVSLDAEDRVVEKVLLRVHKWSSFREAVSVRIFGMMLDID